MTNREALHQPGSAPRDSAWTAAAIFAIVVAVAAAYSNSFSGPFIFDDSTNIQKNATIRNARWTGAVIPPGQDAITQRPLTNLSFAVDYAIGRLDVRSYHVTNLLIHLLATLTLFGVIRRTLRLPALQERYGRASTGLATAVALIWALHPLQTESVTYIVQRSESLMGLCFLLTLYCAIRGATSARPWPWRAAAVIACTLGMGAKEVMVVAPILVLLYDRAFLSGSFRESLRRRAALYLGLAATWAALAAIIQRPTGAGFGLKTITPWEYAITQPGVILHYLALCFWPVSLCLDYSWPLATKLWVWPVAPEAFALGALLAATVWAFIRRPALGFLGAWFFLILAPTSSLMPIQDACFEHRMYLPLAAVVAGAVIAVHEIIRRLARKWESPDKSATIAAAALAVAASIALGGLTFLRNEDYRTAISIWTDTTDKRPANGRAWSNLGRYYLADGRIDDALRCYDRAVELRYTDAFYNRGVALARINDHTGAIRDLSEFIARKPDFVDAYILRDHERFLTHRYAEAIQDSTMAISMMPDSAALHSNRANSYGALGRYDLALADCNRAIELQPGYAPAWQTRARIYFELNDYDHAWRDIAEFRRLGGQPAPGFLQSLKQASGRSE